MKMNRKNMDKLAKLRSLCHRSRNLVIVIQDHPDPDAVAGAVALRQIVNRFGITCSIAHGGMVGRAENRALIQYLGINLRQLRELSMDSFDLIALVDTQPETGNNQLPEGVKPQIIIDHHPRRQASRNVKFSDIRKGYGATSTILCEYLQAAKIHPEPRLATALLYGILSDTSDLGRETARADIEANLWLNSKANLRILSQIRKSSLDCDYFKMLYQALGNARIYDERIFVDIGYSENPDRSGEIADLLVRKEEALWCLCLIRNAERIILSLRGNDQEKDAGELIREIVGDYGTSGGHLSYAGAQIPISDKTGGQTDDVVHDIRDRFLSQTGDKKSRGRRLVPMKKKNSSAK